jgi:hypothetical protein
MVALNDHNLNAAAAAVATAFGGKPLGRESSHSPEAAKIADIGELNLDNVTLGRDANNSALPYAGSSISGRSI